jgi:tetratricopeptide (TPR) repeat protein
LGFLETPGGKVSNQAGGVMKVTILKSVISVALTAGLLMVFSIPANAQNRAIRGKITDENNQPVEGATVRIEGTDIVRNFNLKTNRRGEYMQLLGTQPGTYRVVVRKEGFQPAYKENVRPELGEEVTSDLQLKEGSDYKLPFEMTDSDRAEYQKRLEDQKKRQKFSAEVKARFDQGVTLFDAGQYAEALAEFDAALTVDPKQPGILARAGDCYLRLNRNEEALDAYDKAIELDPGDASLFAQKGVVLGRLGKAAESQEMFQKSAELDPRGAGQNFYNLGVTFYNSGEMDKAAEAFKQSVTSDTNFAESYYMLGISLANDEAMFPAAVEAFKKYIEIGKKADQVQIAKEMIPALGGK